MKKCVIFGAGNMGRKAYYKIGEQYDILYYVDNNSKLWNENVNGIIIVSPDFLEKNISKNTKIFVCCQAYKQIVSQLNTLRFFNIFVSLEGLVYSYNERNLLIPQEVSSIERFQKEQYEKNILFVQDSPCIRTNKIASIMKNRGYKVYLLYVESPTVDRSEEYKTIYDKIFTFWTQSEIVNFVNESEFDIIHCSNAPDYLCALLINCNKPLVYDCHDMESLQGKDNLAILTIEHIANTQSDGVIYTSVGVKDIAIKKFNRNAADIFVLENMILKQFEKECCLPKISKKDNEIHCVYEGGINGVNINSDRYFEKIWKKITDYGIHIHFYSQSDERYCMELDKKSEYLHYEGNKSSLELITEMTQYDCGLAVFNVNAENKIFLETGTANKLYEYINSELPVLVGNIKSYIEFVEKYNVGRQLLLEEDIKKQIENVCKLKIKKNFLQENGLTMESKADDLEKFYQNIIVKYRSKYWEKNNGKNINTEDCFGHNSR